MAEGAQHVELSEMRPPALEVLNMAGNPPSHRGQMLHGSGQTWHPAVRPKTGPWMRPGREE
ncbi:hypothetical protein P7K49_003044, partial [Saguinus oedipus]